MTVLLPPYRKIANLPPKLELIWSEQFHWDGNQPPRDFKLPAFASFAFFARNDSLFPPYPVLGPDSHSRQSAQFASLPIHGANIFLLRGNGMMSGSKNPALASADVNRSFV